MSNFRVVLLNEATEKKQLEEGTTRPVAFYFPTQKQAIADARVNLRGKPEGTYAKIFRREEVFVQDVTLGEENG